jgi:tRNA(Ser,Leu) C12 N-acetylase TAN1
VDPLKVVEAIMEDMKEHDRQLTRYCHRILPVEKAFRAEFFRMKDAVEELLEAKTKGEKHSWALHFKSRNNDKFKYKEVLKTVT